MNRTRLLIVDDEPDFGTFVRRVAEKLGYEVRVTANAQDFKSTYTQFDPAIIVVDILMPDVDGIELIQWLRSKQSKARILIISGYNPRYAKMAEDIGSKTMSVERLAKPVSVADLEAMLKRLAPPNSEDDVGRR
jgi:DNA-binding response OmpR family regulator